MQPTKIYQEITIMDIPNYKWEGYYWLSDQTKPTVLAEELLDKTIFESLPFVIEANFYAKKEEVSIQVKYIDGKYQIALINLAIAPTQHLDRVRYIAHDLVKNGQKVSTFTMIEAWEVSTADKLLAGMATLQPSWTAFAGFD